MTESMASEPAEPTTRPQDDRVGTVRRLGNSWFVKLVQPASGPWHVVCSDGQQNVSGWQDDESMEDCPVVGYLPVVECVPGLLADPAQTTELEKRLDETQQKLAEADRLYADLLAQREQWWESVAKQRGEVEAQRDALSLLLRGMARKLVAARAERDVLEKILSKERRRVDAARALHAEFKIYDECGHEHTDEDVDAGRAFEVSDVGYVCSEGYEYSICRRCCTDDTGFQGEACANHERPCWPCATVAALVGDQPGQDATLGPRHPAGSPEGHFPTDPQMPGSMGQSTPSGDQPKAACECFVVPEEQWTRYYDATEPGSQLEQNPECPVHPAKQADDAAGDLP